MTRLLAAACLLVSSVPVLAGDGDCQVFTDPLAFEAFNQGQGLDPGATEDFEPPQSNLDEGDLALLADPLEGSVPNVDPQSGLGFPSGLGSAAFVIQSNAVQAGAPRPEPGGGLAALGPGFLDTDPLVPDSIKVGAERFAESTDVMVSSPQVVMAVGLMVSVAFGDQVEISVFDTAGALVHREALPLPRGQQVFFGISCPKGIGRINLGGAGGELVDEIQGWVLIAAPCPWDCADGDGIVSTVDFLGLLKVWGTSGGPCDLGEPGVNTTDFLALLQHWGPCPR